MSPHEILVPGGGNEHFNEESGKVWLKRAIHQWPSNLWINPMPTKNWEFSFSVSIIKEIFDNRMVTLSAEGIKQGIRLLEKTNLS